MVDSSFIRNPCTGNKGVVYTAKDPIAPTLLLINVEFQEPYSTIFASASGMSSISYTGTESCTNAPTQCADNRYHNAICTIRPNPNEGVVCAQNCTRGNYGTGPLNRTCTACALGRFAATWGQFQCRTWTVCPSGQYIFVNGTNKTDVVCQNCTVGYFSSSSNNHYCTVWKTCLIGEHVKTNGSSVANRICANCSIGRYTTAVNTQNCTAWTTCELGEHIKTNGSSVANRICANCSIGRWSNQQNVHRCTRWIDCPLDQHVLTNGSRTVDRTCRNCSFGSRSAVINSQNCTMGNCTAGTFILRNATCLACPQGRYSTRTNQRYCDRWDDCLSWTSFISRNSTASNNRSCAQCPSGKFSLTNNSFGCINITVCPPEHYTPDGINCTNWTAPCVPGEFVSTNGSNLVDRACSPCTKESFSTRTNAPRCTPFTICSVPGQVYTYRGNNITDNRCRACPRGQYARSDAEATCHWITDPACPPGQAHDSNLSCTDCPGGKFSLGGNMSCTPHSSDCPPGHAIVYSGGPAEDAACAECPLGTYRTATMAACTPWARCGMNGTRRAGNATHDRVCTLCSERGDGFVWLNGTCGQLHTCGAGTRLGNDLRCYPCRVGHFQNTTSGVIMERCPYQWKNCTRLSMEHASFGSRNLDSVCAPCPRRTFFDSEAQACTPWTNCYVIYEYVSRNGTSGSDRECGRCVGNTASHTPNAAGCNTTVDVLCMQMRGTNCTAQIDFPLDFVSLARSLSLESVTKLEFEVLPTMMLVLYALGLWCLFAIVVIYTFQRPLKPPLDLFEERMKAKAKKKIGKDDRGRGKGNKGRARGGGDCCGHLMEVMGHIFPFLTHFEHAKAAKDQAKGTNKHISKAKKHAKAHATLGISD